MKFNQDLMSEANRVASDSAERLPAEIPGFSGLFVAAANDSSVKAITGFVGENGRSYKIGAKSDT
jgi:hypothetical protein